MPVRAVAALHASHLRQPRSGLWALVVRCAAATLALTACAPPAVDPHRDEQRCWIDGLEVQAHCRDIVVPSRLPGDRRTITLFVARLPAEQRDANAAPVVFLAGGPGQAASSVAGPVARALSRVRRRHDLVFVDVRGTGRSGATACEPFGADADELQSMFAARMPDAGLRRCREALPLPPAAYGTRFASDDLEDVRKALGVERISLYGVSYGSRLALVHLAQHGDHVASAVIDGVMAPETPIFATFDRDAQGALDALAAACRDDRACAGRYGDVAASTRALLDSLATPTPVRLPHPRTGKVVTLTLERAGVAMALRGLLYDPYLAAMLPMIVKRAAAGDWGPLVTACSLLLDGVAPGASFVQLANVTCLEDLPRIATTEDKAPGGFVGHALIAQMRSICAIWTQAPPPPSARLPSTAEVAPQVPLLLLSGALDPVTPVRHAEAVVAARGGRSVVLANTGHWAGRSGCGPAMLGAFFDDPATDLPVDCGKTPVRPPFVLEPVSSSPIAPAREVLP